SRTQTATVRAQADARKRATRRHALRHRALLLGAFPFQQRVCRALSARCRAHRGSPLGKDCTIRATLALRQESLRLAGRNEARVRSGRDAAPREEGMRVQAACILLAGATVVGCAQVLGVDGGWDDPRSSSGATSNASGPGTGAGGSAGAST